MKPEQSAELIRLIRIYVPLSQAIQMLGDLERSKTADKTPEVKALFRELRQAAQGGGGDTRS